MLDTIELAVVKFFFEFAAADRFTTVNLQPQVKVNSGSATLRAGGASGTYYPPMYVKASSLQMVSASNRFGMTVLTSGGM